MEPINQEIIHLEARLKKFVTERQNLESEYQKKLNIVKNKIKIVFDEVERVKRLKREGHEKVESRSSKLPLF